VCPAADRRGGQLALEERERRHAEAAPARGRDPLVADTLDATERAATIDPSAG